MEGEMERIVHWRQRWPPIHDTSPIYYLPRHIQYFYLPTFLTASFFFQSLSLSLSHALSCSFPICSFSFTYRLHWPIVKGHRNCYAPGYLFVVFFTSSILSFWPQWQVKNECCIRCSVKRRNEWGRADGWPVKLQFLHFGTEHFQFNCTINFFYSIKTKRYSPVSIGRYCHFSFAFLNGSSARAHTHTHKHIYFPLICTPLSSSSSLWHDYRTWWMNEWMTDFGTTNTIITFHRFLSHRNDECSTFLLLWVVRAVYVWLFNKRRNNAPYLCIILNSPIIYYLLWSVCVIVYTFGYLKAWIYIP